MIQEMSPDRETILYAYDGAGTGGGLNASLGGYQLGTSKNRSHLSA